MLKVGDKAPDFALTNAEGKIVKLSDFRGKKVIVYFYPKDMTTGCTKEALSFKDSIQQYTEKSAVVLGISTDDQESHIKFRDKYALPFSILSDTKAEVAKKYGVYGPKTFMGKSFLGVKRTTFIIDEKGRIVHIFDKVNSETHAEDVLKILQEEVKI
jgi:thioredoxin-dependent peroxiredoxin